MVKRIAAVVVGAALAASAAGCMGDDTATFPVDAGTDATGVDATVDADAAKPTPLCAPPASAAARCTGSDTTFTFFPALACADAGASDASTDASDASTDASADASVDPCSGTSLDAYFTPAACRAFAAAEAQKTVTESGPRAPTIDEPSDGDVLSADHWAIFAWTKGAAARRVPRALTSLSGDAYVLEFTVECVEVLRVMLAETAWVPDPAAWAILTSQTKPVAVRVVWMRFANDAIAAGPVASDPIAITMAH
jgi:hypothetical protein